ncbi:MAG: sulfite exporter TauE/SafE family protein [Cyanobacteria bacterium J06597_16]
MPSLLDLGFIAALGFLGSFGHCVGMCGPVAAAFALSVKTKEAEPTTTQPSRGVSQVWFHLLLNLGRLLSYTLVGAAIGALGSVVLAGGQMAGVGSLLRRAIAIFTGILLIWFGFTQAKPDLLPALPFLHPARQQQLHEQLSRVMDRISQRNDTAPLSVALTPLLLGLLWGLIPCGFLYAGQLRAAETQSWIGGAAVMLSFGLGTLPAMVAMGVTTALLSRDRRSQLFRAGGWLTILIGALLLIRTGDTMSDYTGHGALICLILALVARPISRLWPKLMPYRRVLGVGAFVLGALHVLHMASHTWNWQWRAVQFMLPTHQLGVLLGVIALLLMVPAALTSFDRAQKALGNRWRRLHLLGVPALLLAAAHTLIIGSSYWGPLAITWHNQVMAGGLMTMVGLVLGLRSRRLWTVLSLNQYYAPPKSTLAPAQFSDANADNCCHTDLP